MAVCLHCGVQREALTLSFSHQTSCQDLSSKRYHPNPDIMMIVIVFLQYCYSRDSFIMIPRYNEAILPVPWYMVILGFHCTCTWPGSISCYIFLFTNSICFSRNRKYWNAEPHLVPWVLQVEHQAVILVLTCSDAQYLQRMRTYLLPHDKSTCRYPLHTHSGLAGPYI